MKHRMRIAVRSLVEFVLRSGDLDLTTFGMIHPLEGLRIHQDIQSSRPPEYTSEMHITHSVETEQFYLDVSGRIDGVFTYPDRVIIEEIKTTKRNLEEIERAQDGTDWGQAKSYAYMYAVEHDLADISVRLTYFHVETGETKFLERTFTREDLKTFFFSLVKHYLGWANKIFEWSHIRDSSIHALTFPFTSYRPGQEKIIERAQSALEHGEQLFMQAPTGIGKTMAIIFSVLKAIPTGQFSMCFYLTARTTGRVAAETTFRILREKGLRCRVISLSAREKVCFNPEKLCNGKECRYARGFFDRLNTALEDTLSHDELTRDVVLEHARKHRVCPFEFSLELSLWVDCVICDYNYAFDPKVFLRRFFADGGGDHVFLIDEAHNLVDRSREMFSADLSKSQIDSVINLLGGARPAMVKSLKGISTKMDEMAQECDIEGNPRAEHDQPDTLYPALTAFTAQAEKWLSRNEFTAYRQDLLEMYFDIKRFLWAADQYNETYATYYCKDRDDLAIKLMCLDPSEHMAKALQRSRTAIFFSATLHPVDFFIEVFGCDQEAGTLKLPSPFDSENFCVLIANRISTLYKYRHVTKEEVARAVCSLIDQRVGNYLIFFPSYEYMSAVLQEFQKQRSRVETIVQSTGMSEQAREGFIERFKNTRDAYLVGFAVMGGVFGESIDLLGEQLTGAMIVGVGMPGISLERELIKQYYDQKLGAGFAYAYQYPGIIKVLQAAGRVIRSEDDRGTLLLVDTRYARPDYLELLPDEWRIRFVKEYGEIVDILQRFWHR